MKLLIVAIGFSAGVFVSALLSYKTYNTDFPLYYYVASTILDPQASNEDIYGYPEDRENKYSIPEQKEVKDLFLYSIPAAYFLAPLALIPYYIAKTTLIFLNMVAYLFAVATILKLSNVSSRGITLGLAISCLWLPFLHTLVYAQINALLLVIVVLAVLAVTRGYPYLCGVLFAFASLFKLFPLAIALVLGIRNRRVLVGFSVVFGASFLVPGSMKWVSTLSNFMREEVRLPTYILWLKEINPILIFLCPVLIGIVTALITIIAKEVDYPLLASFAIPAVFLAMPLLGYYHLTLLVFTYGYLFASRKYKNWPLMGILLFSAVVLGFPRPGPVYPAVFPISPTMYLALFSLWVVMGVVIYMRSFPRNPLCKT